MLYAWVQSGALCTTGELQNIPEGHRDSAVAFPHLEWPKDADLLVFDGTAIREKSPEELRQERLGNALHNLRAERDRRLAATDWVVARAYEQGVPVPPKWAAYRQALRDLPQVITEEQLLSGQIPWPEPPAS
ncbi:phage tail assembly chaperone [Thermus tengchongensis]|uniref:Phage tail assembly chaperone-like domain-containing protein n=1 Tax=Thermus tengchongensis TaxID=1214928 RepID=A0ABY2KBX1_9DEIN|nr:phage tail assembly chaperone [Thermus tengchongensis]TFU17588.1 hypothetical protein E0489_02070 [Thermus tengchongensis]